MKAGVCSYCFNPMIRDGEMTMLEAIEFVGRETVAERFEPYSPFWAPDRDEYEQAREARDALDRGGVKASGYALHSDFAVYDETEYRACVDLCKKRIETARILGADTLRLDPRSSLSGRSPDEADAEDIIARMAKGMAEIADAAAQVGIKVGVENHGRLLGSIALTAQIVEQVNHPSFGVNLDFTNFRTVFGEDHMAAARRFAKQVVHVHAKDFYIRSEPQEGEDWREIPSGEYVKRAVGGEGDTQWPELFRILKEAGYEGTISLEVSDPADINGSVAKGVANIKRIIGEVEAS